MADITAYDTVVKGVNSPNNYIRSEAHLIDGCENSAILNVETHSLFAIPAGNALTALKICALADTASSGSATVQFKAKIGNAAEALCSAIGKADLAAGDVINIPVDKIKGYDDTDPTVIQMTVGTSNLSALKLLVIAEYIPVIEFMTAG